MVANRCMGRLAVIVIGVATWIGIEGAFWAGQFLIQAERTPRRCGAEGRRL